MQFLAIFCCAFQVFFVHNRVINARVMKTIPKTCLDYFKDGVQANGYYAVAGQNGETAIVYCDFTSEPGSAWTLVMSWSLANKNLAAFRRDPLTENVPVNEKTPNWIAYRLPKPEMSFLKSHSTHWRATCSFEKVNIDYRDYLRASFNEFDITTFLGHSICKKVEYVNIRGHVGYQITVPFWQAKNAYLVHTDSSLGRCLFDAKAGSVYQEDNFGHYNYVSNKFRCTSDPTATTQYWFGEYL